MTVISLVQRYWRERSLYVETVQELQSLSDRELNDLGISRCDIRRVAREHTTMRLRQEAAQAA
ncbi:MAG: DUF1127 domain-containing protein [Geminicoccaceae bacterium]